MIRKLRTQWRELLAAPAGRRFRQRYERRAAARKSPAARIAWSATAVLLVVAGIVALPLPGPGVVVIAAGLALLAQESLTVARLCDRAELAIRKRIAR